MDSYQVVSTEVDKLLLHQEICNHLNKKNDDHEKRVSDKVDHQKQSRSIKKTSLQIKNKSKIETITIPATTKKVIINLCS